MYGWASGIMQVTIIRMKHIVQASSLRLFAELSIASSSQPASDWTLVTWDSIMATASFCFAPAFYFRLAREPEASSLTAGIIRLTNVVSWFGLFVYLVLARVHLSHILYLTEQKAAGSVLPSPAPW